MTENNRDLPDGVPASKQQLSTIDPDLISEFATQPGDPPPRPILTFEERAEAEFARLDRLAAENPDATEIASRSTSSDVDGTVARVDTVDGVSQTPTFSATARQPVSYPNPDPAPAPAPQSGTFSTPVTRSELDFIDPPQPRVYDPSQAEGLNSTFYFDQKVRVAESELNAARASGNFATINEATKKYSAAYRDQQRALTARDGVPPNNSVTQADPTAYQAQQYSQNPLFPPPLQPGQPQQNPYGTDEVTEGVEAVTFRDDFEFDPIVPEDDPVVFDEVNEGIDNVLNPAPAPVFTDPNAIDISGEAGEIESANFIGEPPQLTDPYLVDPFATETGFTGDPNLDTELPETYITVVDDEEAKEQQLVPKEEDIFVGDEFIANTEENEAAEARNAALENLKAQKAITQERSPEAEGDWRVKLRLASGSTYLYRMAQNAGVVGNAGQPFDVGILAPLVPTDGIIFPYTPRISTLYQADYNTYSPTHSNYNAYWYKGSKVGEVQIDATFTAQDTNEANYLLAVIHFLKSASKMFYGQDPNRGSPPPLLFLSGLGTYQYNEHPCVITQFNYILPDDVDYIRAGSYQLDGNAAATQANIRNRNASNGPSWAGSTARRLMNGLSEGAEPKKPSGSINLSDSNATYVPTKMAINIVLLPVNNRLQVSQNFSLQEYGNGRLLTGGMW